jgi:hypothetical protein
MIYISPTLPVSQMPALAGDISTSSGTTATTLATVATPGTGLPTINAKGLSTSVRALVASDLPLATASSVGGVSAGTGLSVSSGALAVSYGTAAGTAAQGNDSRITGAAQTTNNLSDLASAATARANLAVPIMGSMIVNGDMDVDQQFEGASNGTGIDRFHYTYTTGSAVTFQRVTSSVPTGYVHSLLINAPATGITVGTSDIRALRTVLEGSMVSPLAWGTAAAQVATLQFWARASLVGNYALSIVNSSNNYSFVTTYAISTANTWQKFTISVPAATAGTWSTFVANSYGLAIKFDLGSGTTYQTSTLNAWQSGSYLTTSGAVELAANSAATLYVTGVHLWAGGVPGTYIPRPYGDELALAQRYYAKTFNEGVAPAQSAGVLGAVCVRTPVATSYPSAYFRVPSAFYRGAGGSVVITTYNPTSANANWRDETASADVTVSVDPSTAAGGTGIEVGTSSTVATSGDNLCIHATYDSGLY